MECEGRLFWPRRRSTQVFRWSEKSRTCLPWEWAAQSGVASVCFAVPAFFGASRAAWWLSLRSRPGPVRSRRRPVSSRSWKTGSRGCGGRPQPLDVPHLALDPGHLLPGELPLELRLVPACGEPLEHHGTPLGFAGTWGARRALPPVRPPPPSTTRSGCPWPEPVPSTPSRASGTERGGRVPR